MLKDQKTNQEIKDFLHTHKGLLIFVADPRTDEMVMSFGDLFSTVQFPFTTIDKGLVYNILKEGKFNDAIDPFMSSIGETMGVDIEKHQQLAHIIGGSIKSIGKSRALSANKKENAKNKKS